MTSVGYGYLVNHIVFTKVNMVIDLLSSFCIILNHPFMGLIMVATLVIKYGLFFRIFI